MKPADFLFHLPGDHHLFSLKELTEKEFEPDKIIEIINTRDSKKIATIPASIALLKFR